MNIAAYEELIFKLSPQLAKAAHSLSAEAWSLDEFQTLSREMARLQTALGVSVEIYSADEPGAEPRARASRLSRGGRRYGLNERVH